MRYHLTGPSRSYVNAEFASEPRHVRITRNQTGGPMGKQTFHSLIYVQMLHSLQGNKYLQRANGGPKSLQFL